MNPITFAAMKFLSCADIVLDGTHPSTTAAAGEDWSISGLLSGTGTSLETWGKAIVAIVGVVMVIFGVVQIAKGMMSGGRGQVNWVMSIGLILLGGMLAFAGGWSILENIGTGGYSTLDKLGRGGYDSLDMIVQGLGIFR